jgi:chemotaxis methyl-accepting protein methylase
VEERPELVDEVLDSLLLGVTQFFRDPPVFACLRDQVLPELLHMERPLRIWSAACSEGQELHSVALLLHAAGGLERCELLGTDLRARAIDRAASGVYSREVLEHLDPAFRHLLDERSPHLAVPARVRDAIQWRRQDLFQCAAPGPWDLILWRNMAIYLEPESLQAVWRRIWRELHPGGYFVTGKAEQPPRELAWVRMAPCVYRKQEDVST